MFRASQRNIERELGNVQTTSSELQKRTKGNEVNLEDAAKTIDGMIARVENLKRKVRASCLVLTMTMLIMTHLMRTLYSFRIYRKTMAGLRSMSRMNDFSILH